MSRLAVFIFCAFCVSATLSQAGSSIGDRSWAVDALASPDSVQRARAAAWVARNGDPADDKMLLPRLFDDAPPVREVAEQGLWQLWSRAGDTS